MHSTHIFYTKLTYIDYSFSDPTIDDVDDYDGQSILDTPSEYKNIGFGSNLSNTLFCLRCMKLLIINL